MPDTTMRVTFADAPEVLSVLARAKDAVDHATEERDDLRAALAAAVSALREAETELLQIAEVEQPTPDHLVRMLCRGEIAEAVLRRIVRAAPPERKRRVGQMMRAEREWTPSKRGPVPGRRLAGSTFGSWEWAKAGDLGAYPVLPEVTEELASAREQLRRLRALSPAVRDVLDEAGWE